MAMPSKTALAIWLAALKKQSGETDIDPQDTWQQHVSETQLKRAKADVDNGLQTHGWKSSWTFLTLKATNPIKAQADYLAATSDYIGKADPLHVELKKLKAKS